MNSEDADIKKPVSIDDAIKMRNENSGASYIAGGMHFSHGYTGEPPEVYISLENLDLDVVHQGRSSLILGAGVSLYELSTLERIPSILKEAASGLPSEEIGRKATIGGNIAAARSDSLLVPPLIVLDASLETAENRSQTVEEYIGTDRDELIINVVVPPSNGASVYKRISRDENGPAEVVVAARLNGNGSEISEARIVIGGIAEKPVRLKEIEDKLCQGIIKGADELQDVVNNHFLDDNDEEQMPYKKYIAGVVVADCVSRCMQALK